MTQALSDETTALAEALRPVLLRLSRQLRRQSQALGLSALDAMLLGAILKHGPMGVSALAEHEQMSRPTISAHIKRLEAAGWIAREDPDPADKRRVGLVITAAGREALEAVRQRRNDWLAQKLADLPAEARAAIAAAVDPLGQIVGERP